MKAAVVTSFDEPPTFQDFSLPDPLGPDDAIVDVLAAGLHPRVRSQADGTHYTSTAVLPLIPGIDGVGRTADGSVRYFILPDTTIGSLAERTIIDRRRSVELPAGADPVMVAAAMNPAMSSWLALRRRVSFTRGQSVLVLGATGNAGRLAVQVSRHLGAGQVVAVGRGAQRLESLGADRVVSLDGEERVVAEQLADAAKDIDVVIDYLWGQPTRQALYAIIPHRANDNQTLNWVQVGSVAGPESAIPSAALRAARLDIVGSGQGSVSTDDIVAELEELARVVCDGAFSLDIRTVSLHDIEHAWTAPHAAFERQVVVP